MVRRRDEVRATSRTWRTDSIDVCMLRVSGRRVTEKLHIEEEKLSNWFDALTGVAVLRYTPVLNLSFQMRGRLH